MDKKSWKLKKYIDTYVVKPSLLGSLVAPALVLLFCYFYFEVKSFKLLSETIQNIKNNKVGLTKTIYFTGLAIVSLVAFLIYDFLYASFSSNAIRIALGEFIDEFLKVDYRSFHRFGMGEIQYSITRRFLGLIYFLSSLLREFLPSMLFFIYTFVSLGSEVEDGQLKVTLMIALVAALVFSAIIQYFKTYVMVKINEGYEFSSSKMQDILYNYELVNSYDNVDFFLEKYRKSLGSQTFWSFIRAMSCEIVDAGYALLFIFLYYHMLKGVGEDGSNFIDLRAFTILFNKAKDQMIDIQLNMDLIAFTFESFDQKLTEDCPMDENKDATNTTITSIDIVAKDVDFSYIDKPILKSFCIHLLPCEKIAITGVNGSGKSTFTKILLGLYDYQGSLKIDGIEYSAVSKRAIRDAIAYIPQKVQLFDTTVLGNLKFSNQNISDEKVVEFCKTYKTHELFKRIGYNKEVGEYGKYLSGGQRQKICFMRAVLKNSLAIVLDEATSNMDEASENDIIQLIKTHMPSKTVIMIIHNLSLLKNFDRVIFFDENNQIETGKFDELLKNERFSNFYNNSMLQNE